MTRDYLLRRMIVTCAGPAAGTRCLQGSEPGWTRTRSRVERIAFHEAAHAVANAALGGRSTTATIVPVSCEGGVVLGSVNLGEGTPDGSGHWTGTDGEKLREAVAFCTADRQKRLDLFRWVRAEAERLLCQFWPEVTALANELLTHKSLDRAQIERIVPFTGQPESLADQD